MSELSKKELEGLHNKYVEIAEFVRKKQYEDDNMHPSERIKLFIQLYSQNQLNKLTRNLVQVTLLLVVVAFLQLMKDLKGTEYTLIFLTGMPILIITIIIYIIIFSIFIQIIYTIIKEIFDFCSKKFKKEGKNID